MTYLITDDCTMCGACVDVCEFDAIVKTEHKYVIDTVLCQECGACVDACPEGAIINVPGDDSSSENNKKEN